MLPNKANEPTQSYTSSTEAGIFRVDIAIFISVDVLPPCAAIPSAASGINYTVKPTLVFHEESISSTGLCHS